LKIARFVLALRETADLQGKIIRAPILKSKK
jgi:hypothetical protein